eukprot:m.470600 g.470600  ORF g.470600 m.470600 type:complete len:162 (-) comp30016_c0_seq1:59-544(-)
MVNWKGMEDAQKTSYMSTKRNIFTFLSIYSANAFVSAFACNAVFSVLGVNSVASIVSMNSMFSIMSLNSFFAINCTNGFFQICGDNGQWIAMGLAFFAVLAMSIGLVQVTADDRRTKRIKAAAAKAALNDSSALLEDKAAPSTGWKDKEMRLGHTASEAVV